MCGNWGRVGRAECGPQCVKFISNCTVNVMVRVSERKREGEGERERECVGTGDESPKTEWIGKPSRKLHSVGQRSVELIILSKYIFSFSKTTITSTCFRKTFQCHNLFGD